MSCKTRRCLDERKIELSCQHVDGKIFFFYFLAVSYTIDNVCKVSLEEFVFVNRVEQNLTFYGRKERMHGSELMSALL